jgi:hypothetical protein
MAGKQGTYRLAHTFAQYNEAGVMVYETARSPIKGPITITGTTSYSGTYSTNARINRVRIYSTLNSGTVYYLEKVITNTVSGGQFWTTLSMPDSTLQVQATAYWTNKGYEAKRLYTDGVFPPMRYSVHAAGRLWFAGRMHRTGTNEDATLYWSELAPNYEDVPTQNANTVFAKPITGLYEFNELVYVFTRNTRWRVTPADYLAGMEFDELEGEIGCVGGHTIRKIGSAVVWLHDTGIYATTGDQDPILISGEIEDTIRGLDADRLNFAWAMPYDWDRHELVLWVSEKGQPLNEMCLVGDMTRGVAQPRWTARGGLGRIGYSGTIATMADGKRYSFLGDHLGNVWQEEIGSGDGASDGGTYQGTLSLQTTSSSTTTTKTTTTTTTTTSTTT